jgi:citrate/tricarballylate utilization protein
MPAETAPTLNTLTASQEEAARLMRICNACRYCEGLCAVFPAMMLRTDFAREDLDHLANLCHACGACHADCQYAPPHEFAVDVPRTLAAVREESYAAYAWPRALKPLFARNGLAVAGIAAFSVGLFLGGFMAAADPTVMFGPVTGAGAFYAIMPHAAMVWLFGGAFLYALVALALSLRNYGRATASPDAPRLTWRDWKQAVADAGRLRYLDGGGYGCGDPIAGTPDRRRLFHHLTFYGFGLCFAATCVATLAHYVLGWAAPYAWTSLPVLLGTLGGIGITIGPVGLWLEKRRRPPELRGPGTGRGMDVAFLAMLAATGLTGLALLVFKATPAMGTLLAVHLGFVFAFFLTMPYGKFVHGLYRFAALVRYAGEKNSYEKS